MHIIRLGGRKHSARILHDATVCTVRPVASKPLLKRRTAPPASAWRRFSEKPHVSVTMAERASTAIYSVEMPRRRDSNRGADVRPENREC